MKMLEIAYVNRKAVNILILYRKIHALYKSYKAH